MRLYVCKNHGDDGDVHLAVFTTHEKAEAFCREADGFHFDDDWLFYWEVDMTDSVETEIIKYSQRRMTA